MIAFTKHARDKFGILRAHGVHVSEEFVRQTVETPDLIDNSRAPLKIAQRQIDDDHVLRVVYRYDEGVKLVITFYPGRTTQYGK